ncbi:hypothetical protein ACFQ1I_28695 [Kitasatospora arboriphila]
MRPASEGALALAERTGGEEGELGLVGLLPLQCLQFAALGAGERADHVLDGGEPLGHVGLGGLLLGGERGGLDERLLGLGLQLDEGGAVRLEAVQEGLLGAARGVEQLGDDDGLVGVLGEHEVGEVGGPATAVLGGGELGGDVHAGVDRGLLGLDPGAEVGDLGLLGGLPGDGGVVLLGGGLGLLVELVQPVEHRAEGGLGVGQRVGAAATVRVGAGVGAAYAAVASGSDSAAAASTAPHRMAARTQGRTPFSVRCPADIGRPPQSSPARARAR